MAFIIIIIIISTVLNKTTGGKPEHLNNLHSKTQLSLTLKHKKLYLLKLH